MHRHVILAPGGELQTILHDIGKAGTKLQYEGSANVHDAVLWRFELSDSVNLDASLFCVFCAVFG